MLQHILSPPCTYCSLVTKRTALDGTVLERQNVMCGLMYFVINHHWLLKLLKLL